MTNVEDTGLFSLGSGIVKTCLEVSMSSMDWEGKSEISTSLDIIGPGISCPFCVRFLPFRHVLILVKDRRVGFPNFCIFSVRLFSCRGFFGARCQCRRYIFT